MTAPHEAERRYPSGPAVMGARVVALIGAVAALFALALPWASEENTLNTDLGEALLMRGDTWTGWSINGTSRLDGHRPVTLTVAMILVTGTVLLALASWALFERPATRWLPAAVAGLALIVLVVSVPGLDGVDGRFGTGHTTVTEFGVVVWRLAVATNLIGACRLTTVREDPRTRFEAPERIPPHPLR